MDGRRAGATHTAHHCPAGPGRPINCEIGRREGEEARVCDMLVRLRLDKVGIDIMGS